MRPKPTKKFEFEKVNCNDWVNGEILDIQRDENHEVKFGAEPQLKDCVRFVFGLEGYQYKHYSRWMTFSYNEKANLYKKYLVNLVVGVFPDCDFDIEQLIGMKIKTMWQENKSANGMNTFQSIETIRPRENKIEWQAPQPQLSLPSDPADDQSLADTFSPDETEEETGILGD